MTSILTNVAAMAALQTLRSIDRNLETTQARVSSGLRVEKAEDNAAYWSIATTMRSDSSTLSTVQDALGLGAAKVDTAYEAMESAIATVQEIKSKLVAAYGVGVDRSKIQEEITQLQEQLSSISESASFSGENWIQGRISDGGSPATPSPQIKEVVSAFTRGPSGEVAVTTVDYVLNSSTVLFDTSGGKLGILDQDLAYVAANELAVTVSETDTGITTNSQYAVPTFSDADLAALGADGNADASIYDVGGSSYFKVTDDKWVEVTTTDPAAFPAVTTSVHNDGTDDFFFVVSAANSLDSRKVDMSVVTLDITTLDVMAASLNALVPGSIAEDQEVLDIMTSFVDKQLLAMTSAASSLGSIQSRVDLQEDFIASLVDVIDKGIGRLVDADMNEESTRLKALQTQQQLGIQSLSIANTNAESILTLFRQ
ncbi:MULTISPECIES: flagellin N-terminal helical domain-containing protein [Pseudorhizobium]|jgi:flagellin|uniref:Flagellin n=1 Tax=Pseudorhizobium pelagicum TaxID=1509405 RepID=A0A922TCL0_9HYPH|nr:MULTISPECIES: flagellin [Pseudorhizobium]MBU1314023.1 flagellar protein FlaD [Alphaproteobacteria bacterium]KEQ09424.1 flagellar protein FlaD [Pseudorhizobium pelagicum]KEQ10756.1 flagellar protein FlaD [Pseudorhizobium pelagicum]MBU1552375.1 flagellar protein FlaD [Alphaproteobacteria bacterium]MBU2339594.1 flagellar protein FlaD [Alphaproteobacteria bacterium]